MEKVPSLDEQMKQIQSNSIAETKLISVTENHWYAPGFGNIGLVITEAGIVVIDTALNQEHAKEVYRLLREITNQPIRYIIYTHGHFDHVSGASVFKEPDTKIIAHANITERFYKYKSLETFITRINGVQFSNATNQSRSFNFVYPDITFHDAYQFELGGKLFHVVHGKGETDDHCFVFVPEDRVVYSGDFFIWSFPNIGNPLKVVRFEHEWAMTLENISQRAPQYLVPGHGPYLSGEEIIQHALSDVKEALNLVHEEVLHGLNEGHSLHTMLETIHLPEHLQKSPYIRESYGSLEFSIRGTHRRYTGWFDGNPTHLRSCRDEQISSEIMALIGDGNRVMDRARSLVESGEHQLAMHLLDVLIQSSNHEEAKQMKSSILHYLSEHCDNFILRNIYKEFASESIGK